MGCVAALLLLTTESVMASSLMLLSPAQVAGNWTFYLQQNGNETCTVKLKQDGTFSAQAECLKPWLGSSPATWFPTPDGLMIIGKDDSKTMFLALIEAGRYERLEQDGKPLVMKRAHLQSVK